MCNVYKEYPPSNKRQTICDPASELIQLVKVFSNAGNKKKYCYLACFVYTIISRQYEPFNILSNNVYNYMQKIIHWCTTLYIIGMWDIFEKYTLHTFKEYAGGFSQLPAVTMPGIPDYSFIK